MTRKSGNTHAQYESAEQRKIFDWAEETTVVFPELALLHHIPNGGKRNAAEAANLKRQGVKPGVPDISLPVPRGKYHGLYIELKVKGNKTSDKQDWWLRELSKQGHLAVVCYGASEAVKVIKAYLQQQN